MNDWGKNDKFFLRFIEQGRQFNVSRMLIYDIMSGEARKEG